METETELSHLIIQHAPYVIGGVLAIIGVTVLVLHKFGVLMFGDNKNHPNELCKHCTLGNNNNHNNDDPALPAFAQPWCASHESLQNSVSGVQATQIEMLAQQKVNTKALNNGKAEFKEVQDRIGDLRVGMAVLLDRSGADIPQQFKEALTSLRKKEV